MFKNFLKTAVRNLIKNKFYSILNVTGLAIGIGCTILILLFIQNEFSFDDFHVNADRIYRVTSDIKINETAMEIATLPAPAAEVFMREYPEVENTVRFRTQGGFIMRYEDTSFKEQKVVYTDSSFFDVFSFKVIQGNASKALAQPFTMAINKTMAEKYFGKENPIGKIIRVNNNEDFHVTAVYEDMPKNSHINYDFLLSLNSRDEANDKDAWLSFNFQTYLLLKESSRVEDVAAKFPGTINKYCSPLFLKFLGKDAEQLEKEGSHTYFLLEPLKDIYLYSTIRGQLGQVGDIKYVYIFGAIAVFILLIACINFINLSTAHSAGRAKEVGIRKTLGSFKKDLVIQFIIESFLLSLVATIIAVGLVELALPSFNELASREIETDYFGTPALPLLLFCLPFFVGFLAGAYPAFYISNFNPVAILRGKIRTGAKSGLLRSGLVIFQFTASIILLVGTITVFKQLNFIQDQKLGYNKEQVLVLNDAYLLDQQTEAFKNEMLSQNGIVSATVSGYLPTPSNRNNSAVYPNGQPDHPKTTPMYIFQVDYDYIKTMGMEIKDGRDFSREFASDSSAIIINEAALKYFEWKNPFENTIGLFTTREGGTKDYNVIGVVKDFNHSSLREKISPLVMVIGNSTGNISFRLKTDKVNDVISVLEKNWKEFTNGQPFSYNFLDENFNNMYQAEQKLGKIFGVFASLAIVIGCLGLFGLAAFTAQRRTKEIGIRKVMGASVPGIVAIMSTEFTKLIFVSFIIATPLAYLLMDSWLQDFAYKTELGISVFLLSGGISFVIAILTVSYHAIKSALANPVKSLRYE